MAKFEINIELDDLKRELSNIVEDINEGVEQGLEVCANEIKKMEKRMIDKSTGNGEYVVTGQLERSVKIMPLEWSPGLATISVTNSAIYADLVEKGTGEFASDGNGHKGGWVYSPDGGNTFFFTLGMPPHMFAQDSYDHYNNGKAKAIIEEEIYKCIRR